MVRWLVGHSTTVLISVVCIVLFGTVSYVTLPRESSPDITIPVVLVTTPYVGVSPGDVEGLVTIPLERELSTLQDVKKMSSTSAEGVSIVSIEFEPDVVIEDALQKVRDRVSRARAELPGDVEEPSVREISFSDMPILIVNIAGGEGEEALKVLAEDLQDRTTRIPGVLDAKIAGGLDREVQVQVDPTRLAHYGLALHDITGAIGDSNSNIPGGEIRTGESTVLVRAPSEISLASEVAGVPIKRVGDRPVFVRDVARVVDGFAGRASYARMNGQPSVSVSITKRPGANIIEVADNVKALVAERSAAWPEGVAYEILADQSDQIRASVDELQNNIITALFLVVAVIFAFMGVRSSTFVAVAIPLSMLMGFMLLDFLGFTLNMIVLFSLILALGMLVDNAIVVVENVYRHYEMGKPREQAAVDGTNEVALAVAASTATTVAAFFPLVFWDGIMGEFMGFLPKTLIIVLISSLVVAVFVLPVLTSRFLSKRVGATDAQGVDEDTMNLDSLGPMMQRYRTLLKWSISRRYVSALMGFGVLLLTFAVFGVFNHGTEFFPDTEPNRAVIGVRASDGTDLDATDRVVRRIEQVLAGEQNVDVWVAETGVAGGSDPLAGRQTSTNEARITVDFLPDANNADRGQKVRVEPTSRTIGRLREVLGEFAGVEISVEPEAMGPPVGDPIAIEVTGDSFHEVGLLAQRVRREVAAIPGVTEIADNYRVGRPELQLRIDRGAAERIGVKANLVGNTVRTAVAGAKASEIRDGEDKYDIVVELDPRFRSDLQSVLDIRLPGREDTSPDTFPVPMSAVASYELAGGTGAIQHIDQDLVVTITGDVLSGFNENEVRAQIDTVLQSMEVPEGYYLRLGGAQDEQAESMAFLMRAFGIAVALILLVLVSQFDSVAMPAIILASVILSLTGVLWGLLITGTPFGIIMTGIGVISLAGVVVNNAIVLLDYVQQLEARGLDTEEALVRAGVVRFRPVMLTAVTTVLGLIPMALGFSVNFSALFRGEFHQVLQVGGQSAQWWGPMAIAVIFGLSFATLLTLVLVPTLYSIYDDFRRWRPGNPVGVSSSAGRVAATGAMLFTVLGAVPSAARAQQPLTLAEVWRVAERDQLDFAIVEQGVVQTESLRGQAWAALSPKLVANGALTFNELEIALDPATFIPEEFQGLAEPGDPVVIQPRQAWSGSLTVQQPLFSGTALPGLRGAYATVSSARFQATRARQQMREGIARTFYNLYLAQQRQVLATENLERAQEQLQLVQRRADVGVEAALPLVQAQVAEAQARRDLRAANNQLAAAVLSFENMTGILAPSELDISEPVELPDSLDSSLEIARASRPDVAALRDRERVLRMQEVGTWAQWAPRVDASFSWVYNQATGFANQNDFWVASIEGNWTIWDGGAIRARARGVSAERRALSMELEKLEGDVDRDIRLAWMALESAREAQDEVALEVTLAEQAFELAERSYQAGLATWLDVEQARTSLSGAQLASISSRAELDLAGIALVSAMGMLGT